MSPTGPGDEYAALIPIRFSSHGAGLNGVQYAPAGPGPHPTVLVLHGLPGYERNLDLAQACRRAGWNAVVFHYRGAWGSDGAFGFGHVLEDVGEATRFLRSASASRVDADRIALVGHSLGGFAALLTAASDSSLLGVGSLAGYNLGSVGQWAADGGEGAVLEAFQSYLAPLRGTDPARLLSEIREAGNRWDLASLAPALADRPVLLVGATRDAEAPLDLHHRPVARALRKAGGTRLTEMVLETDHAFSDRRIELIEGVVDWLGTLGS